jgi:GH15 family glucan-1,4-alpha-glucosidase
MPGTRLDYDAIIAHHLKVLEELQLPSGLFRASSSAVTTGYDKAWLRDNFYECLAFEYMGRWDVVNKTYRAILDIFLKHEKKIDQAIKKKPINRDDYIHPRYHPETFEQFWEDWGNKQNDAIGAILFRIGELESHSNFSVINTKDDKRIIQKLVNYLESIEYWVDYDNGMWEENEEIHASSVGACVAGLKKVAELDFIHVSPALIKSGERVLRKLLPRESEHKFTDMALLSLIYPYNIVTARERDEILSNLEYHLVKDMGVLRYKNDMYYNRDEVDRRSQEAEWTFGFSWLAIIFQKVGNQEKAKFYLKKAMETINHAGEIPELYYSHTEQHNENSPLGWSESMFIVAMFLFHQKYTRASK